MITATSSILPSLATSMKETSTSKSILETNTQKTLSMDAQLFQAYLDFNHTLNLTLLDKFQDRSNISLILIQIKCDLQNSIKELNNSGQKSFSLEDTEFLNSDKLKFIQAIIKKQHSGLLYVFKRALFYDIIEIKEIYGKAFDGLPHILKPTEILPFVHDGLDDLDLVLKLTTSIHADSEYAWGITLQEITDCSRMILCCSDSIVAYYDFKESNDHIQDHATSHHRFTTLKHLLSMSFLSSCDLRLHHDNKKNNKSQPKVNQENMKTVESLEFKEFYNNRLKVLRFEEKKIF